MEEDADDGSELDFINLSVILAETSTYEQSLHFCHKYSLVPRVIKCPKCSHAITTTACTKRKGTKIHYMFKCNKRSCRIEISSRRNTWFDSTKLSIRKSLVLTYCFVQKFDYHTAVRETSGPLWDNEMTSLETVSDIYSYCREVCVATLFSDPTVKPEKIGGIDLAVEIHEAQFGKRKVKKGKVEEGQWMLGGICRETKETFFLPVDKCSKDVLCGFIEKFVERGSILYTDSCTSYKSLVDRGFQLRSMNNNNGTGNSVDPDSGACADETLEFETSWKSLSQSLSANHARKNNFGPYLAEYIWRQKRQGSCLFTKMLQDIATVYPGV